MSVRPGRLYGGPPDWIWKIPALPNVNPCPERDGQQYWENNCVLPIDFPDAGPSGTFTGNFQI